ncbi:MAG TPA: PA14 domain-containing protein, partial [Chloroflexia bacterium]|nr:PA14 domain-containing protein [Chloroflexia bacterium]
PIEAALLILGIAFALWRWRDTRMACLSIWFWGTVIAGGALTIDAPYVPRLVGLVPTLAIFIALPLNKLCAELEGTLARGREQLKTSHAQVHDPQPSNLLQPWYVPLAHGLTAGVLVGLLGYLSVQNVTDYMRYMNNYPYPALIGQAQFVRQMNKQASDGGRPMPRYYDLGVPTIYWGHGINRFLNRGTPGQDMTNPSDELPIINDEDRDVVFIVWDLNRHYLPVLKTYYPGGEEGNFTYGPEGTNDRLFTYYHVKKEQLDARRRTMATYIPATGPPLQREEHSLGTAADLPGDLSYPVRASWSGGMVVPAFGPYRFSIDTSGDGNLTIDGTLVLTTTAETPHREISLVLARGLHDVQLSGTLADSRAQVTAKWLAGSAGFVLIPRQYLWYGPGRGLLGQVFPFSGDLLSDIPSTGPKAPRLPITRLDGFLGFRHSPDALTTGPFLARWAGTLIAPETGHYRLLVNCSGESALLIDGKVVIAPGEAAGQVDLTKGNHRLEVRYNWSTGTGYLEVFWMPPRGGLSLLGPDELQTEGGIVGPSDLASRALSSHMEDEPHHEQPSP